MVRNIDALFGQAVRGKFDVTSNLKKSENCSQTKSDKVPQDKISEMLKYNRYSIEKLTICKDLIYLSSSFVTQCYLIF